MDSEKIRQLVREGYSQIARKDTSGCSGVSCCGSSPEESEQLARHVGYSLEELQTLPDGANLGLSCGNPTAIAALKPGEVVVDLGAGAGFDAFIAGRKVGATGRVIGVDMTSDMLAKARANTAAYRERSGLNNVEFRLGEIEHLPIADASVDVIISNCVINLSPDKAQVWREMFRVLKPGGRVAVSDMALLRPLPASVKAQVEALVGCVAGAVLAEETAHLAREAGFGQVRLNPKKDYVEALTDWNDPLYKAMMAQLPPGTRPGDFITSLEVTAVKTARG